MAASISKTLVRNLKALENEVSSLQDQVIRATSNQPSTAVKQVIDTITEDCYRVNDMLDDAECGRLDEVFEFGILVDD